VPSLLYHHREGVNPQVANRGAGESEIFGMKISELLLPAAGHRVTALRELKADEASLLIHTVVGSGAGPGRP
jgi:phosphoglycerol transferase